MVEKQTPLIAAKISVWMKREAKRIAASISSKVSTNKINLGALLGKAKKTPEDIINELDLSEWDVLAGIITDETFNIFLQAYEEGLAVGGLTDLESTEQMNAAALDYAKERGAELVGMKIDEDGNVVENPNAEWSISESTRDRLRTTVADSIENGDSSAELADRIESSFAFSDTRATTIARTEIVNANVQGNLAGWDKSGVVSMKQSVLGSEHDVDDDCDSAAEDGPIALDEAFSNGFFAPPYHPNCVCDLLPVLTEENQLEEAMATTSLLKLITDDHASTATGHTASESQIGAGNYRKGHLQIGNLNISIENTAGTHRRPEWPELQHHYGYIRGTVGADGDHVDCFVRCGISKDYDNTVWVINQNNQDGTFDEHKCMIGWSAEHDAKDAYLENYTKDWKGLGSVVGLPFTDFEDWIANGNHKQPLQGESK